MNVPAPAVPERVAVAPAWSPHAAVFVQRKCACGPSTASVTDECEECQAKALQRKLAVGSSDDPLERERVVKYSGCARLGLDGLHFLRSTRDAAIQEERRRINRECPEPGLGPDGWDGVALPYEPPLLSGGGMGHGERRTRAEIERGAHLEAYPQARRSKK